MSSMFFCNDTATTEIYTLSLHDALPISSGNGQELFSNTCGGCHTLEAAGASGQTGPNLDELKPDADRVAEAIAEGPGIMPEDRQSTRLNSSHANTSYAVFCLNN